MTTDNEDSESAIGSGPCQIAQEPLREPSSGEGEVGKTNYAPIMSASQTRIIPASSVRHAVTDDQPQRPGYIRALVTKYIRIPPYCTGTGKCETIADACPYCADQLHRAAARQFRRAWCAS